MSASKPPPPPPPPPQPSPPQHEEEEEPQQLLPQSPRRCRWLLLCTAIRLAPPAPGSAARAADCAESPSGRAKGKTRAQDWYSYPPATAALAAAKATEAAEE